MVYKKNGIKTINFKLLEKILPAYLQKWTLGEVKEILNAADDAYYNGESIMSDSLYDSILEYYTSKTSSKTEKFGHESAPVYGTKVKLPINMGSMDKVKPGSSDLKTFLTYKNLSLLWTSLMVPHSW